MSSPHSGGRTRILVIHGPNLNLLGVREPAVYGTSTLAELDAALLATGADEGVEVRTAQANSEGALIDLIHATADPQGAHRADGVVFNPGGYTHTSVALHDALRGVGIPCIEVHLSNLYGRESFRHTSVTGAACVGVIMGLGADSYHLAIRHLARSIARDG
jgi:3-dehydroquinate dehydratase-2